MKMKYFDRAALREVRNRMEEALKKVSDDLGISFEIGKIRYSSDMFRTQIICVVANTSDDSSVAKVQWNQYCSRYSLSPDDFGKTFKSLSKTQANANFEIVGCKPKSHKYPILAKNLSDGKTYKFPVSRVRAALNK